VVGLLAAADGAVAIARKALQAIASDDLNVADTKLRFEKFVDNCDLDAADASKQGRDLRHTMEKVRARMMEMS
jgi:hypothetical protein